MEGPLEARLGTVVVQLRGGLTRLHSLAPSFLTPPLACGGSQVGCMLGFYIVTCDRERDSKFNDGRSGVPNMETSFVPMHSVTLNTTLHFDHLADGKVYMIIPATFEPGKQGPFHVSVTLDCDFTLRAHK